MRSTKPAKPTSAKWGRAARLAQPKRVPAGNKAALMRIPAPSTQPWNLSLAEVDLVRNHIAKGASDTELQFCLAVARRHRLDPFRGQIWFVKRRDRSAEGGYRWIPIVGINGLLHVAARDHKDFGSNDDAEFGPMHTVKWQYNGEGKERLLQAPEWARVKIWKKGHEHPVVSTVYWDEIYPNIDYAPLVRQMPRGMLEKCALAKGTRRAYPATDGLYIKEEFQGPPEFTPAGRIMEIVPAQTEAEKNWDAREAEGISKLTPAQREVVARKMAESKSSQVTQPAKEPGAGQSRDPISAALDSLRYELTPSGSFFIDGPDPIKKANRDLLAPLYVHPTGIMATAQQLGKLISEFERRRVPFRDVTPQR